MLFEKQIVNFVSGQLQVRQDNPHGIFYFSPEDFPGLRAYEYAFPSSQGHTLRGFFYCYDNPIPGRVLVFDHGMGNGHRAYMREIECLAKAGYLVFSYDHTGCMASGGANIGGFAQSLHDLDDCMKALKVEEGLQGRTFSVMGHSWGGFSTMNIAALHPEITHVVSMSGFVSVRKMLEQLMGGGDHILIIFWHNGEISVLLGGGNAFQIVFAIETLIYPEGLKLLPDRIAVHPGQRLGFNTPFFFCTDVL